MTTDPTSSVAADGAPAPGGSSRHRARGQPVPGLTSVVLPAHNEAGGIGRAIEALAGILEQCSQEWEIVVVDDGSTDGTYEALREICRREPRILGIRLSRNFGKEAALLAGLEHARGRRVITMDADLQHPPDIIPSMLERWADGAKLVHAVKTSRESDSLVTRLRASLFNKLVSWLGGINLQDASDFKLLDREVVDTIVHKLPERERFYRGLTDWVGYPTASVSFTVNARTSGVGKWSVWRLVQLAITALVSFTSAPLRIVTVLGFLTLLLGLVVGTDALITWWHGVAVSGFATTIIVLLMIGSFIMISLGIIGEYIAKIYEEVKKRPIYLIQHTTASDRPEVGADGRAGERTRERESASAQARS